MTIASNITKIRRLVNDVNSQVFSDAQILAQVVRAQQEFCRITLCEVGVCSLVAPPQINYIFTHAWEEAYVPEGYSGYSPFFRNASYAATQPWELEQSQVSSGGWTVTSGADLLAEEAQHPLPFVLPSEFYAFKGLLWSKKWIEEKSMDWLQRYYRTAFMRLCDVVDYFSPTRAGRLKAFFTEGVPTTQGATHYLDLDNIPADTTYTAGNTVYGGESGATATVVFFYDYGDTTGRLYIKDKKGTFEDDEQITNEALANGAAVEVNELSISDKEILANTFHAIYSKVPDRPTATTDTLELHPPFHKYVEFRVADRLLRYDGPKKNEQKAEHMKLRWEMGVRFVKDLMWKLLSSRKLHLGGLRRTSLKPGRPRLPAHYPEVY